MGSHWLQALTPEQQAAVAQRGARRLLKLHGCVDHPDDIVLTREDYLRYEDKRGALAGIVQALLITRHMLFVGLSLADDNFLRIIDEVRKAIGENQASMTNREHFGTTLVLHHDDLLEQLWQDDLDYVAMSPQPSASEEERARISGEAARQLETFLDYLLAEAPPVSPRC